MTRPELLAPAGEPRALRAALSAGADAVYFGLARWSARAFAGNFGGEAVPEAVETAHLYDARAYLALNTLLKDDEVEPALAALQAPYLAGLDALIVADLGFAARVREEYPDLPLHASTQLNTHSSAQLAALERLGFSRAILARELSLAEIAALETRGLELEAFVHGALCYGYSGDCLLSSMVGGRSGNRGRCSQSCRLRYSLKAPGLPALEPSRIMSTSDLSAIGVLPGLLAAGVTSIKVEGRMKDAAYVGVTTSVYREALDAALADPQGFAVRPEWSERLEQSFSRSFTTAHLQGRHDDVRSGGRGGHRGVLVGRVSGFDEATGLVRIKLSKPVAEGDVVYLYTPWGQTEPRRLETGGDATIALRVRERVAVKDRLFRLAAADVGGLGRDLVTGRVALRPIDLTMRLSGAEGSPAALAVADPTGGEPVTVSTAEPLAAARTAALTETRAREALGALGATPYRLAELEFAVEGEVFLAVGDLKELRRRAVAALGERRVAARRRSAGRTALGSAGAALAAPVSAVSAARTRRPPAPPGRPAAAPRRGAAPAPARRRLLPGRAHGRRARGRHACARRAGHDGRARAPAPAGGPVRCRRGLADGPARAGLGCRRRPPRRPAGRPDGGVRARVPAAGAQRAGGRRRGRPRRATSGGGHRVAGGVAGGDPGAGGRARRRRRRRRRRRLNASAPALQVLAFGRQQVLHTRDQLGRAEGLYEAPGPDEHVSLLLEDAKGYEFPAEADAGGTRIFNARVTNLAPNLDELRAAGVATFVVQQAAMDEAERAAFAAGGLKALAPLASRERSTTGHLFRGVA